MQTLKEIIKIAQRFKKQSLSRKEIQNYLDLYYEKSGNKIKYKDL